LCAGTELLCSGTVVLRSRTELLCRSFVLCAEVLPSPLPSVRSSLLQAQVLRADLLCPGLRADLWRSGHLRCRTELLRC
jgi:hypothetical protein